MKTYVNTARHLKPARDGATWEEPNQSRGYHPQGPKVKKAVTGVFKGVFTFVGAIFLAIVVSFMLSDPPTEAEKAQREVDRLARRTAWLEEEKAEKAADLAKEKAATAATEAKRLARAKKEKAATAACRQDVVCYGKKFSEVAERSCRKPIEKLANYEFKWIDNGWRFSRSAWVNKEKGIIAYLGDEIKFQNGFGAWQNIIYACTMDTRTNKILKVIASPGRLP